VTKPRDKRAKIRVGGYSVPMPGTRRHRTLLGAGLCAGGVVGFLPVVGFWMLPLGLIVLSVDSPSVRRLRRRAAVRWGMLRRGAPNSPKRKGRG
jgi:hypothetical protein